MQTEMEGVKVESNRSKQKIESGRRRASNAKVKVIFAILVIILIIVYMKSNSSMFNRGKINKPHKIATAKDSLRRNQLKNPITGAKPSLTQVNSLVDKESNSPYDTRVKKWPLANNVGIFKDTDETGDDDDDDDDYDLSKDEDTEITTEEPTLQPGSGPSKQNKTADIRNNAEAASTIVNSDLGQNATTKNLTQNIEFSKNGTVDLMNFNNDANGLKYNAPANESSKTKITFSTVTQITREILDRLNISSMNATKIADNITSNLTGIQVDNLSKEIIRMNLSKVIAKGVIMILARKGEVGRNKTLRNRLWMDYKNSTGMKGSETDDMNQNLDNVPQPYNTLNKNQIKASDKVGPIDVQSIYRGQVPRYGEPSDRFEQKRPYYLDGRQQKIAEQIRPSNDGYYKQTNREQYFPSNRQPDKAGPSVYNNDGRASIYADKRGPSIYADKRGPSTYADNRGPSTYADKRGPSTYMEKQGAGVNKDNNGPTMYRDGYWPSKNIDTHGSSIYGNRQVPSVRADIPRPVMYRDGKQYVNTYQHEPEIYKTGQEPSTYHNKQGPSLFRAPNYIGQSKPSNYNDKQGQLKMDVLKMDLNRQYNTNANGQSQYRGRVGRGYPNTQAQSTYNNKPGPVSSMNASQSYKPKPERYTENDRLSNGDKQQPTRFVNNGQLQKKDKSYQGINNEDKTERNRLGTDYMNIKTPSQNSYKVSEGGKKQSSLSQTMVREPRSQ